MADHSYHTRSHDPVSAGQDARPVETVTDPPQATRRTTNKRRRIGSEERQEDQQHLRQRQPKRPLQNDDSDATSDGEPKGQKRQRRGEAGEVAAGGRAPLVGVSAVALSNARAPEAAQLAGRPDSIWGAARQQVTSSMPPPPAQQPVGSQVASVSSAFQQGRSNGSTGRLAGWRFRRHTMRTRAASSILSAALSGPLAASISVEPLFTLNTDGSVAGSAAASVAGSPVRFGGVQAASHAAAASMANNPAAATQPEAAQPPTLSRPAVDAGTGPTTRGAASPGHMSPLAASRRATLAAAPSSKAGAILSAVKQLRLPARELSAVTLKLLTYSHEQLEMTATTLAMLSEEEGGGDAEAAAAFLRSLPN